MKILSYILKGLYSIAEGIYSIFESFEDSKPTTKRAKRMKQPAENTQVTQSNELPTTDGQQVSGKKPSGQPLLCGADRTEIRFPDPTKR